MNLDHLSIEELVYIWKVWYKKNMSKTEEKYFKAVCKEYKNRTGRDFPKKHGKSRK